MTQVTTDRPATTDATILRQIFDYANRANPYPLWAKLRQTPVCWQEGGPADKGTYVVSTYREVEAILHDPRVSSDFRNSQYFLDRVPIGWAGMTPVRAHV